MPINFKLKLLYHIKKMHQNPLGSFEEKGIHKDRQTAGSGHRLTINRLTKRGKEKSPSIGHCQCEKDMEDCLLACQQFLKESRSDTHSLLMSGPHFCIYDINIISCFGTRLLSLLFYSVSGNANSMVLLNYGTSGKQTLKNIYFMFCNQDQKLKISFLPDFSS
jgi:hypothetical protein